MTQENVEISRRILECWNRDDWQGLADCFDPGVEAIGPREWPEGRDPHGWEETRQQFERLKDSWGVERAELDEVREVGDDRVLARFRWIVSGRASGVPVETPFSSVATFREGKIIRIAFFLDHAEALKDAGISER